MRLYLAIAHMLQDNLAPAQSLIKQVHEYAEQHGFLGLLAHSRSVLRLQQLLQSSKLACSDEQFEHILAPCLQAGLLQAANELQVLFAQQLQKNIDQEELLSPRELEVLQWIADGLASKHIAEHMHISVHTVKAHIQRIYKKLEVSRRTQAVAKAQLLGLFNSH